MKKALKLIAVMIMLAVILSALMLPALAIQSNLKQWAFISGLYSDTENYYILSDSFGQYHATAQQSNIGTDIWYDDVRIYQPAGYWYFSSFYVGQMLEYQNCYPLIFGDSNYLYQSGAISYEMKYISVDSSVPITKTGTLTRRNVIPYLYRDDAPDDAVYVWELDDLVESMDPNTYVCWIKLTTNFTIQVSYTLTVRSYYTSNIDNFGLGFTSTFLYEYQLDASNRGYQLAKMLYEGSGWTDGYLEGLNDGYEAAGGGTSPPDLGTWLLMATNSFMNFKFGPQSFMTIGSIIGLAISIYVVKWFLKLIGGG